MRGLLVDNWTLEKISLNIIEDREDFNDELIAFIESIVLWEDIFYFDNGYSEFWHNAVKQKNQIDFFRFVKPISYSGIGDILSCSEKIYQNEFAGKYSALIAKGAIEYLGISNELNLNYMPFEKRANFLNDNIDFFELPFFTRENLMRAIDNDIISYIRNFNNKYGGSRLPIHNKNLFQYLRTQSYDMESLFQCADELKKSSYAKSFREWISLLEDDVNRGYDFDVLKRYDELREIEDMINFPKSNTTIDASIQFPPSLGISASFSLKENKPHLIFPMFVYKAGISNRIK